MEEIKRRGKTESEKQKDVTTKKHLLFKGLFHPLDFPGAKEYPLKGKNKMIETGGFSFAFRRLYSVTASVCFLLSAGSGRFFGFLFQKGGIYEKIWKEEKVSLLASILAVAFLFGLLPAVSLPTAAGDVLSNSTVEYDFDETRGTISGYGGSGMEVVIPESINGVKVTGISSSAFWGCSSPISITIPAGVTEISDHAFDGCSSLTEIQVAENNPAYCSVDGVLFSKDQKTLCHYPAGRSQKSYAVPAGVTEIGSVFEGCSSLTDITIPDGVTTINERAFAGCSSLVSIAIPASVTEIGYSAFEGCSSLTDITIPAGVTKIGSWTFKGCSSLVSIAIPASVTEIVGYSVFAGCSSLTSITIPAGVTEISDNAFNGCSSLSEIRVAENNPVYCSVDGVLFSKDQKTLCCYPAGRSEKTYAIPAGVTTIDEWTLEGCSSLTSIAIPDSVTTISCIFYSCSSLSEIQVAENNPVYCSVDGVLFSKDQKTLCHYPKGRSEKTYAVPAGVTEIDRWTFEGCSSLTGITIPAGVTEIGRRAFAGCSSLSSITIPDSVTKIYEDTLFGCESLTRLNLQSGAGTLSLPVSVSASADVEGNAVLRILYPGTKEEWSAGWESSGIQNDYLRAYLTSRVVYGAAEAFVWGDVDGNGKVESKDKVLVSRYLAKWTMAGSFHKAAADFNKDGDITSAEAVVLARYLAKWTNLPYPVGQKAS